MRVAIVHDWFVGGGAERVVLELHKMYPEAPIYTSYCSSEWRAKLDGQVVTGFLQHWPFSKLRKFLPILRIWWFSRLKLDEFDLVVSSSGAEAKGIRTTPRSSFWARFMRSSRRSGGAAGSPAEQADAPRRPLHINYCHAPTHYYWSRYDQYLASPGFGRLDPVARFGLKMLIGPLRKWDYKAAQRPDYVIANSSYTRQQIQKYYGREASVVHPPVDVDRFKIQSDEPRRGFVTAGRQTPYKKTSLAVRACTRLNLPLIVIGNGPQNRHLKRLAGRSVTFLRKVSDEKMAHYFATSEAFLFPSLDDFGIVAVEAMAAGTPVVAYAQGGALDYVSAQTGILFPEQTTESLVDALGKFKDKSFNHNAIAAAAAEFSPENFQTNFANFVQKVTEP